MTNEWAGGHDAWIDQVGSAIQCGQSTNQGGNQVGKQVNEEVHKEDEGLNTKVPKDICHTFPIKHGNALPFGQEVMKENTKHHDKPMLNHLDKPKQGVYKGNAL